MRRATVLIVWLVLLAPAASAADGVTADEVVRRVAETYATLKSFRLVRTEELRGVGYMPVPNADNSPTRLLPAPLGWNDGRYETELAESEPGKLRLVLTYRQGTILLVADTGNTWLYLPGLKQYLQEAAATIQVERALLVPLRSSTYRFWAYLGENFAAGAEIAPYLFGIYDAGRSLAATAKANYNRTCRTVFGE